MVSNVAALITKLPDETWRHDDEFRTRKHKWGLPHHPPKKFARIHATNRRTQHSIMPITIAHYIGIPAIVVFRRPPSTDTISSWELPQLQRLRIDTQTQLTDVDLCTYGAPATLPIRIPTTNRARLQHHIRIRPHASRCACHGEPVAQTVVVWFCNAPSPLWCGAVDDILNNVSH